MPFGRKVVAGGSEHRNCCRLYGGHIMDSRAMLSVDIGFYIETISWALVGSLCRIYVLRACQKNDGRLIYSIYDHINSRPALFQSQSPLKEPYTPLYRNPIQLFKGILYPPSRNPRPPLKGTPDPIPPFKGKSYLPLKWVRCPCGF